MMKKIGITGGIGSGKTTICKIFESLNVPIYYADVEAKKIMASNLQVKSQLKEILGEKAYHKNGKPDRKYIASKIFSDKELMSKVEKIIHPAVLSDSERWMEQWKAAGNSSYVLKEAALLVENGTFKYLDALIVVTCPENIRIKRVMKRDKLSFEDVMSKVKNQLPEDDKVKVADYIIINDGIKPLIPQIWEIHNRLTN